MIDYDNEQLRRLPVHLRQYIVDQHYDDYSPSDHAVWRYAMRQNIAYLPAVAHESYLEGLEKAGISIDKIPNMYGMNRILKEIGWAAAAVDGFIPPAAFMEFQAFNVLVIAEDIRKLEHIEYTPAPDIIHEAAGHAPIIANPAYAEYLRYFGEIGSKAFSSAHDKEVYEAIRRLSILKEHPDSDSQDIKAAEKEVERLQAKQEPPSEMALLRNMHWWTVEYGLIGNVDEPKIYGAGLLSSIGESVSCMGSDVKKIPYDIAAADKSFDITTQQPQLYVAKSFGELTDVLNEFADNMALRKGGSYGLDKAIASNDTATVELDSGLQVSGNVSSYIEHNHQVIYFRTEGSSALAYENAELMGHDKSYHAHGYGSPIGPVEGSDKALFEYNAKELEAINLILDQDCLLKFQSGIALKGRVSNIRRNLKGNPLLVTFEDCTVTKGDKVLFDPSWGSFDMLTGSEIVSVFAGAADKNNFHVEASVPKSKTIKKQLDAKGEQREAFYAKVRAIRENHRPDELEDLWNEIKGSKNHDWLLLLEMLEISSKAESQMALTKEIVKELRHCQKIAPNLKDVIENGLRLIDNEIH